MTQIVHYFDIIQLLKRYCFDYQNESGDIVWPNLVPDYKKKNVNFFPKEIGGLDPSYQTVFLWIGCPEGYQDQTKILILNSGDIEANFI